MTALPNNDRTVRLAPSAGATSLVYDFWIARAEDLAVWRVRAGTATLLTLTTDYSVAGAGADAGGTVTLAAAAQAGDAYVLAGSWQIQQVLDLVTAGDFRSDDVDHQHRLILAALMELRRDLGRALTAPAHATSTEPLEAATRPINGLMYLEFDEAAIAAPAANKLRLYAKDVGGITKLFVRTASHDVDLTEAAQSASAAAASAVAASVSALAAQQAASNAEAAAQSLDLPALAGQAGKFLRVKTDESGYDHATSAAPVQSVNGEIGNVVVDATNIDAVLSPNHYTPVSNSIDDHLAGVDDKLALVALTAPQGRLSLSSGVPVMTTTVIGAGTVRYVPYVGQFVPLYDGTDWVMTDIGGELIQATTDTTKSPAAVTSNSNYDAFVWNDAGTKRCTRGPAWSSGTARGTGAGTTELELINGILVNKHAIANGPAARRGTYVGTIRTNASSLVDFDFGGLAAGGDEASFGVWNMYHRRKVAAFVGDTTDSWTYASSAWRAANNSLTYRVSYVSGLAEDAFSAEYSATTTAQGSAGSFASIGVGYDSVTAASGRQAFLLSFASGGLVASIIAKHTTPGLGWHYMSALEYSLAGTSTFNGDQGGPGITQSGLHFEGWM